jgi:hypothetical protein
MQAILLEGLGSFGLKPLDDVDNLVLLQYPFLNRARVGGWTGRSRGVSRGTRCGPGGGRHGGARPQHDAGWARGPTPRTAVG